MITDLNVNNDNILQTFLHAANTHDFSLDITFTVKGAVISGTMISAKNYFAKLSETFEEGNVVAKELSGQLAKASQAIKHDHTSKGQYVHLENVKVYIGDSKPTPSTGDILWRGKLSEIDGFFLGRISGDD
jgi:hypothetical protein